MKIAIIDRDGSDKTTTATNHKSPAEWRPIPGSIECDREHEPERLSDSRWQTNQSGIGELFRHGHVETQSNDKMMEMVFRQGGRIDRRSSSARTPRGRNANCPKPGQGCSRRSTRASTRS